MGIDGEFAPADGERRFPPRRKASFFCSSIRWLRGNCICSETCVSSILYLRISQVLPRCASIIITILGAHYAGVSWKRIKSFIIPSNRRHSVSLWTTGSNLMAGLWASLSGCLACEINSGMLLSLVLLSNMTPHTTRQSAWIFYFSQFSKRNCPIIFCYFS